MLGLVSGCASVTLQTPKFQDLPLLSPMSGPGSVVSVQRLVMEAQGRSQEMVVVTRINPSQVRMQALLPTGQTLLKLDYDGKDLKVEQVGPVTLPATEIMAMMQFAHWSFDSVAQQYPAEAGWTVSEDANLRLLRIHDQAYLTVAYFPHSLEIENHRHQYRVRIETLELSQ